jgi:hypothetical protein
MRHDTQPLSHSQNDGEQLLAIILFSFLFLVLCPDVLLCVLTGGFAVCSIVALAAAFLGTGFTSAATVAAFEFIATGMAVCFHVLSP